MNPSFEEGAVNPSWPLDWNLSFPVGEVNEQMRDVSAMVDAPSDPGRMIIQVTVESRDANYPELEFRIDNIRVQ